MIKTFLGYLPSNHQENPPKVHVPETSGKHMDKILEIIPEKRNRTYDMHRILECIVDSNSLFFVKPLFGTSVITALSRIGGESVGIIASQPLYNAGAMDTDGIDKVTSFMCLCDSYNIPLVFFHDTPGFLVGNEAENNRVGARVMNHLSALAQVTVPKISVIIRKSFGMAYYNMCGSGCGADFLVAWPTAEMSFIDPEIGFNVIYGNKLNQFDMASKDEAIEDMIEDSSPYGAAGMHYIHDVIDPHETRNYIVRALEICRNTPSKAISKHKLANWPTKF
jgi:acetyl-CoA carboxylase carboxyltransferase component